MFNASNIIRNNNATFYDFGTRKARSQRFRFILTFALALIVSITCSKPSDTLIAGVLAVQAVLLGFTVNVMFFLVSNRETNDEAPKSIEGQLRAERLRTLHNELFHNVSYFNLLVIALIVVATVLLFPVPEIPSFLRGMPWVERYAQWLAHSELPYVISVVIRACGMFVFYFLIAEVVFSIARLIGRTSFYFERKLQDANA